MNRTNEIVKVSIIGIATNAVLAAIKIAIGTISGSIAIRTDGINNMGDSLISVLTLIGARLAVKEPDRRHPFGYGRIESVVSLIIGLVILYAGFGAFRESILRITNPVEVDYSAPAITAISIALVFKVALGIYTKRRGKELESTGLLASGEDSLHDSLMSAATIISALIYVFMGVNIEQYIGVLISLFIIKTGIDTVRETVSNLLGERISVGLVDKVKESIMSFPEVLGVYDIALHSYGKERMIGSAHIEIPEELKVAWIDNLQRAIAHKVYEDTGVEMMGVSVYAVNSKRSASEEIRGKIAEIVSEFSEVISMHGFYIDITDRAIRFDVVTDFGIKSRGELAERIKNRVEKEYSDYEIEVHVDYALTDQQLT